MTTWEEMMGRGRRAAGAALMLAALSGAVGALAGCTSSSSSSSGGSQDMAAQGAAAAAPATAAHGQPAAEVALEPARLPSDVIRTADLGLRVPHGRIAADIRQAADVAAGMGGYVSSSRLGRDGPRSGSIVIRVPVRRFQPALAALARLGTVQTETITGQDVSQDFVDLGARLENLRSQETFLRGLMARAQTISGSIDIENHLTTVQLGIERITGQIRYLRNRASFSTLAVALAETGAAPPAHHHASSLWKAAARSLDSALSVVEAVIVGAGYVVPVALLALLALGAGRLLWPRLRVLPQAEPGGDS